MVAVTLKPIYQQSRKRHLEIGEQYLCQLEPENPYDANAVMVKDGLRTVAYLRRDSARCVSRIMNAIPKIKNSIMPEREPKYTRKGPEQFCSAVIVIKEEDFGNMKTLGTEMGLFVSAL